MNTIQNAREVLITDPSRSFSGNAPRENGSTVEIVIDKTVYKTVVENGKWSWTPPEALTEGEHVMSVRIIDRAGNIGAPTLLLLHVDTAAPDAPVILQVYDNAGSKTGMLTPGDITDDTTPTLKGVAEPGSTVKIYDGEKVIATVKADKNGLWQIDVELDKGEHQLRAEATDAAGHTGPKSEPFTLTIDVRPEGIDTPPVLTSVYDDVGPGIGELVRGNYTNDNQPTLSGTGLAGQTVNVLDNGIVIGSATIGTDGKWSFTPDSPLEDGEHIFTVAHKGSDVSSPDWPLFVDTDVPEAPVINQIDSASLLMGAQEGLFIDNGKTQRLLSEGDEALGTLRDALNAQDGSWIQQAGTVTIAGVHYNVFSHGDADLLVQEGVKNELV